MSFDPYECARNDHSEGGIDPEKAKRVMGGQACVWTEQTDEMNLESIVWPRAAAVADLFWTGDKAGGVYPRGVLDFRID
jgi:hexosaminidase